IHFFLSSRRQHTRFSRDWSSDVCYSDLHFYTSDVDVYDELLNERIKFHFRELNLGSLYMSNANSTVTEIQFRLRRLHEKGGKNAVRGYLEEEEESRRKNQVNSWNTAAYQAMMSNDWFCDGGFNEFKSTS